MSDWTSAVPASSLWAWPCRPLVPRSSASPAVRPRWSCTQRSSRPTTPGFHCWSVRPTGLRSSTRPARRRPSNRTISSAGRSGGRSLPVSPRGVTSRRGGHWRRGPLPRRARGPTDRARSTSTSRFVSRLPATRKPWRRHAARSSPVPVPVRVRPHAADALRGRTWSCSRLTGAGSSSSEDSSSRRTIPHR